MKNYDKNNFKIIKAISLVSVIAGVVNIINLGWNIFSSAHRQEWGAAILNTFKNSDDIIFDFIFLIVSTILFFQTDKILKELKALKDKKKLG